MKRQSGRTNIWVWVAIVAIAIAVGLALRDAYAEHTLNRMLDDAIHKLEAGAHTHESVPDPVPPPEDPIPPPCVPTPTRPCPGDPVPPPEPCWDGSKPSGGECPEPPPDPVPPPPVPPPVPPGTDPNFVMRCASPGVLGCMAYTSVEEIQVANRETKNAPELSFNGCMIAGGANQCSSTWPPEANLGGTLTFDAQGNTLPGTQLVSELQRLGLPVPAHRDAFSCVFKDLVYARYEALYGIAEGRGSGTPLQISMWGPCYTGDSMRVTRWQTQGGHWLTTSKHPHRRIEFNEVRGHSAFYLQLEFKWSPGMWSYDIGQPDGHRTNNGSKWIFVTGGIAENGCKLSGGIVHDLRLQWRPEFLNIGFYSGCSPGKTVSMHGGPRWTPDQADRWYRMTVGYYKDRPPEWWVVDLATGEVTTAQMPYNNDGKYAGAPDSARFATLHAHASGKKNCLAADPPLPLQVCKQSPHFETRHFLVAINTRPPL